MRNSVELREERLARSWGALGQETELTTVQGDSVRVVYPGRRNTGPGPDFLDAVLETPGGEVRGAVEVHQRTSDWERHGHGADAAYGTVILHVVGAHDGAVSRPPGGTQLPLIELDREKSSGSGTAANRYRCASQPGTEAALARAGDERFGINVERLGVALRAASDAGSEGAGDDPGPVDQIGYEEIAAALGYARNSSPMRELAHTFSLARVRSFAGCRRGAPGSLLRAEALLLGGAGLLPSQRHLPARRRRDAYAQTLERVWQSASDTPALRAYRWDHGQSRPENGPVRRVVALAHVALKWPGAGLSRALRDALAQPPARVHPSAKHAVLAALVSVVCPDGYWLTHWDFGVAAKGSFGGEVERAGASVTAALVGSGRAADVVVNVLLPLAAADGALTGGRWLADAARHVYATHPPLAENWITRVVRDRSTLMQPLGARAQQGLIDVYERTCHALHCAECPLGTTSVRSDG